MPQTGQQIIKIYILPNISSSKDTQAMKFSQLTKQRKQNSSSPCRKIRLFYHAEREIILRSHFLKKSFI